ncbi:MAG: HAD family phosphatase [Eubacteriales bacterium]|nr:HAD family phosphatase [Eubacteriales bacterium]
MKKIDAIIFDMDGVLIDSEVIVVSCWKEIGRRHNSPKLEEAARVSIGLNGIERKNSFLKVAGEDLPYEEYAAEQRGIFADTLPPLKKGVREIIAAIKKHGIPMGLATSTQLSSVKRELSAHGIFDCFDVIVTRDMIEHGKPAPDIYLKACEELKADPANAYGVEDSRNGLKALYDAGLHTILVPDLVTVTEEMHEMAEAELDSLLDVIGYLGL